MHKLVALVIIACSIGLLQAACPQNSAEWCKDFKTAKECNTLKQCGKYVWFKSSKDSSRNVAHKANVDSDYLLNLTVYYETLCRDSRRFITTQLWNATQSIGSIMNVTLVPYGNTKATWRNETKLWQFACQHGREECIGNQIQTCFFYYYPQTEDQLPFLNCMELNTQDDSETAAQQCADQLKLPFDNVLSCSRSRLGNSLEHLMGVLTDALNPPHTFIPWITLNGQGTADIQNRSLTDLTSLLCDSYKGPNKPAACPQKLTRIKTCMKNF